MAHPPLTVRGKYCVVEQEASETPLLLEVGSAAWFALLDKVQTFSVQDAAHPFTARKQLRAGHWYWYAQRRLGGRLRSIYIGRTPDLTLERLRAAAQMLLAKEARAGLAPAAQQPTASLQASRSGEKGLLPQEPLRAGMPPIQATWVVRSSTREQVQQVLAHPLTLVSAPISFGKTTLLAQWAALSGAQVAWVALEEGDREPLRFWAAALAALADLATGVKRQALKTAAPSAFPHHEVLAALLQVSVDSRQPVLLVLDQYDAIQEEGAALHEGLAFLVEHLPPQVHLVLAGRSAPPLPLARLRAHGSVYELRARELRLSREETAEFLFKQLGVFLAAQDVAALHARTEGWVAGLQLAAQALKGEADLSSATARFTGEHPCVVAFVRDELLSKLPAASQQFLLEIAILGQLNAAICQAVTGMSNSQELLEMLARAGYFLFPLEGQPQSYRLHLLVAEALRLRLQESQPERMPELCLRASEWYEAHGNAAEAIAYAFAGGDLLRAARLLEANVAGVVGTGVLAELQRWLKRLSLAESPKFSSHALEVLLASFQREDAGQRPAPGASAPQPLPAPRQPAHLPRQRSPRLFASGMLVEPLSKREREILGFLGQGASNKEIARHSAIALTTVKRHLSNIYAKLGVHSRTEALVRAQSLHLIEATSPE